MNENQLPMRRPLLSLALAFGAGIVIQDQLGVPPWIAWSVAGGAGLAGSVLARFQSGGPLRFFVWLLCLLALGCARGLLPQPAALPDQANERVILTGVARSSWELMLGLRRLELEVLSLRRPGDEETPVRGRALISVFDEPRQRPWAKDAIGDERAAANAVPCPTVLPGDRVRLHSTVHRPHTARNPGVPDFEMLARRRGIDWRGTVESCGDVLVELTPGPTSLLRWVEGWRDGLHRFLLAREGSAAARGIMVALTTGEEGRVPPPVWESFRNSGLAHLLSISGLHLAIVALGLYTLLVKLFSRIQRLALAVDVRRAAAVLAMPATVLYTLLAGAHLPVLRSAIMVLCFLLAVVLRRESDPLQTLAAAALIILGLWPQSLFEVSFQLSFVAVAALLILVPAFSSWLRLPVARADQPEGWPGRFLLRVAQYLLVSLAATLGTAPLVAWHFNQASLVGLFANLVAVPLATLLIVPLGLLSAVLLPVSLAVAGWTADLGMSLSDTLAGMAAWFSGWPGSSFHPRTPWPVEILLWYATLFLMIQIGRRRWAIWATLGGVALLLVSWGAGRLGPLWSQELRVTFIDVGQGDAALVQFPGGRTLLVDGGSDDGSFNVGERVVAPFLWSQGITRLDAIAVSHAHPDHFGGLAALVRLFEPSELWCGTSLENAPALRALAAAARQVGTKLKLLQAGDRPLAGEGLDVSVLWPRNPAADLEENDRSLMLRLSLGQRVFLLAGDVGAAGEDEVLSQGPRLKADVLKVAHHGSGYSSAERFLAVVGPRFAVISVGERNRYGLPDPEAIERLEAAGARVLRTDRNGAVMFATDGNELEVQAFREEGSTAPHLGMWHQY